jgi:hypothetical protein
MAMLPQFWSLNALAVELGMTQRTIAAALRDVPADGKDDRGRPGWHLLTALTALGFRRDGRKSGGGDESYEKARTRYMRARARTAEHEAAKAAREDAVHAGELVPIGPVSAARGLQFKLMANHLMRLPAALPPLLAGQSAPKMQAVLKDAIREALQQIADCEIRVPKEGGAAAAVQHPDVGDGPSARAPDGESTAEPDDFAMG